MMKRFASVAAGCFAAATLSVPATANDNQLWSALAVNGPVDEDSNLLLWFDGHARFRDDASDLGVSIIRPGIGWRASANLDLWLGYARVTSHLDGPDIAENRIWQQATYPVTTVLGGSVSGRTRLEQRFRETGDDTGWRLRQFVRWARPLEGTPVSFVLANEVFVGLNGADWGQRSGFDQNRGFAGINWKIRDNLAVEAGYLNNLLDRGDGFDDQMNHNLSVALFVNL